MIDFGLAVSTADKTQVHREMVQQPVMALAALTPGQCGSPYWMPPEMILRQPHGTAADIWSMAVCVLELANHHPPDNSSVYHLASSLSFSSSSSVPQMLRHMFMTATGRPPFLDQPQKWHACLCYQWPLPLARSDHPSGPKACVTS